jgi:hypothetical protein
MAIEIPKIEWFEGLSQNVKCSNCQFWIRCSGHLEDPEPSIGECGARGDMSCDDFFCKYFQLRENVR